jgi:alpha-L-rhamnosidase
VTTPLTPAGLRCAHKVDPLGVAPDRIRFSWILEGAGHDRAQTSYQVLVTMREADGPLVWDSGRVASSASADVGYGGPSLAAGSRYRWKVQAWDESGQGSEWSSPAAFETELDQTGGWYASWIGLGQLGKSSAYVLVRVRVRVRVRGRLPWRPGCHRSGLRGRAGLA